MLVFVVVQKVDGTWGPWSYFGDCSNPCGSGNWNRTRTCSNPAPQYGGVACTGDTIDIQTCTGPCAGRQDVSTHAVICNEGKHNCSDSFGCCCLFNIHVKSNNLILKEHTISLLGKSYILIHILIIMMFFLLFVLICLCCIQCTYFIIIINIFEQYMVPGTTGLPGEHVPKHATLESSLGHVFVTIHRLPMEEIIVQGRQWSQSRVIPRHALQ